ncbi:hypothetical protein BDD12DRAFT_898129 [Trichophaea hybrida]|nr:hypothetical protein BDD12DRAFT_898129 [Trichophaea hybrida]
MESLPDALPLTPISSMLAGIDPNEFDDPTFSDDESSLLSSVPNTLMTPSFGTGTGSAESSASDTSPTTGSTIYKRQKIKRKSYLFNAANGVEYISKEGKLRWRCMHCPSIRSAQTFAVTGTKNMIEYLRDIHNTDKNGPMDSKHLVSQRIDKVFGKTQHRIEFNLDLFKQLLLLWIIVNHIAFRQVESHAFRMVLFYLLACCADYRSLRIALPKSGNTIRSWIMTLYNCG